MHKAYSHAVKMTQHALSVLTSHARSILAFCALVAVTGCSANARPCVLERVTVVPDQSGRYVGRRGQIELRLRDERPDAAVKLFPETDIEVRRIGGSTCVAAGGVWARRALFAASDGRTFVALESSGSSDALVFFDSRTCHRVGVIDVSNASWFIAASEITVRPAAARSFVKSSPLDTACRPLVQR